MIIGSKDPFYPNRGFEISVTPSGDPSNPGYSKAGCAVVEDKLKFIISHFTPVFFKFGTDIVTSDWPPGVSNTIEKTESFFQDRKLAHLQNYKYLPPVNEIQPGQSKPAPLGKYAKMQQKEILKPEDLKDMLGTRPYFDVDFVETSRDNNLLTQFFEYGPDGVKKLSIIDFQAFFDQFDPSKPEDFWNRDDSSSPGKRVFFVGKIYRDLYGSLTFINMFTVVFD
jgi:hypothetical protein